MLAISEVQNYLVHLRENITEIKTDFLVIDDSQINVVLADMKSTDNLLLLGIIPSHKVAAVNEDNFQFNNVMALLVMKKADRGIKYKEFIANLAECQETARKIVVMLREDMYEYNDGCSFLNQLNMASIEIDPVWGLGGADGYEINFSLKTPISKISGIFNHLFKHHERK